MWGLPPNTRISGPKCGGIHTRPVAYVGSENRIGGNCVGRGRDIAIVELGEMAELGSGPKGAAVEVLGATSRLGRIADSVVCDANRHAGKNGRVERVTQG